MSAVTLLDPPDQDRTVVDGGDCPVVFTGLVLGHEVVIAADAPVPVAALEHLLLQLDDQWEVRRRRSDLGRLTHLPNVVIAVSPVTLLLVRNVVSAIKAAARAGAELGGCQAVLDLRHGRVGLDPTAAALSVRLAPAVAVDVLVDFCSSSGVRAGYVRVGALVRDVGDVVPAWLRQLTRDGVSGPAQQLAAQPAGHHPGSHRRWACTTN